jgi:hypothetical protein
MKNSVADLILHTFVFPNGQQIQCRFSKNVKVAEAAAAFKAQAIAGFASNAYLNDLPSEPLCLCYYHNIVWNGICFTTQHDLGVKDCPEEDKRYVRTTIHTPDGPVDWYERQQKLRMTVNHEKLEYSLTGTAPLAWIREWFEQKANCHCEIQFFSGETEISRAAEPKIVALDVEDLSVIVKTQKGKEFIQTSGKSRWKMELWSNLAEGTVWKLPPLTMEDVN